MEKIPKQIEQRMTISRELIRKVLDMAYGCYIEQESTKTDSWRDMAVFTLADHALHETDEIKRSNSPTLIIHNGMDLINLGAIIAAKGLLLQEMKK